MNTDNPFYLRRSPLEEKANPIDRNHLEDPVGFSVCECGHDLSAHQVNQSNPDNHFPCAGCVQQYGHGGCRAGGFQNAGTRYELLTDLSRSGPLAG